MVTKTEARAALRALERREREKLGTPMRRVDVIYRGGDPIVSVVDSNGHHFSAEHPAIGSTIVVVLEERMAMKPERPTNADELARAYRSEHAKSFVGHHAADNVVIPEPVWAGDGMTTEYVGLAERSPATETTVTPRELFEDDPLPHRPSTTTKRDGSYEAETISQFDRRAIQRDYEAARKKGLL